MSGRTWKRKIVAGYLKETGKKHFVPDEFLAWLKDRPGHEAYAAFYGADDGKAA